MIPSDLKYTREHEWVKIEGNIAIVGITHFAQDQLGDIVYVDISHNQTVKKDDVFGTIEAVKTVSDLFMPLSGTIFEINPFLDKNPELVNTDPYGDGWMVMIEIDDPMEIDKLLTPEEYDNLIN
jgi:glycine cleavage system H protein